MHYYVARKNGDRVGEASAARGKQTVKLPPSSRSKWSRAAMLKYRYVYAGAS